jgi:hypothetical protein
VEFITLTVRLKNCTTTYGSLIGNYALNTHKKYTINSIQKTVIRPNTNRIQIEQSTVSQGNTYIAKCIKPDACTAVYIAGISVVNLITISYKEREQYNNNS